MLVIGLVCMVFLILTSLVKSDLSYWDVSNVEDFRLGMQLENINPNINNWDVSKATNMSGFFSTSL